MVLGTGNVWQMVKLAAVFPLFGTQKTEVKWNSVLCIFSCGKFLDMEKLYFIPSLELFSYYRFLQVNFAAPYFYAQSFLC